MEDEDRDAHQRRHTYMHALAHLHDFGFRPPFRPQNVHRERGGQGSHCRACRRIGGRDKPDDEQDAHHCGKETAGGYQREKLVAPPHLYALPVGKEVKQYP